MRLQNIKLMTWDRQPITFQATEAKGMVFFSDDDARPLALQGALLTCGTTEPIRRTNWTAFSKIRAAALKRFGEDTIRPGTPTAQRWKTRW
jgi:hypothetical protein